MLALCLTAKGSNGTQRLICERDGAEIYFCLIGDYEGSPIQIDFNLMRPEDVEDFIHLMQRRVDAAKSAGPDATQTLIEDVMDGRLSPNAAREMLNK